VKHSFHTPARLRASGLITAAALVVGLTALATASSASASTPVASGSNWTVSTTAGGYEVDLTLADALPVRDDIPELYADGAELGPATESADGKTLSITTTDSDVATATSVSWQWSSGGDSTATGSTTLQKSAPKSPTKSFAVGGSGTTPDPTAGTGAYTVADYNFGAQSIALANLGGVRGELEGRIYLPSTSGEHPLVIFLHGRHSTCYNTTTLKSSSAWPCPAGTTPILSYAGYDGAGDALAAAGYTVVSISANSINANDGSLGADAGAVARGQLILDSLTMLKAANAGSPVTYHDAQTNSDVTLDQALVAGKATSPSAESLTAADLVGTMDFSDIGLMGHSRGGEGAVTAGVLNEGLAHPWSIKSIFNLAPIDFTRATLPDVITTTLLPYCDGDVSDQQGQHFYADSRNAFDDNVLRSDIWVMGTDHDFYNTSWTPPYPGAADDWTASSDPVCGTNSAALASGSNIRLTAAQEYSVGTAYLAGFFELTLGNQTQYLGMFDGAGLEPSSVSSFADVRTVAQQPSSKRDDITDFASTSSLISTTPAATDTVCASMYGRTVLEAVPSCTSAAIGLTSQAQPYWTPASYAPNVPLNQMTHLTWTGTTGSLGVTLPKAKSNVSAYDEMTVNMSPDESVTNGTDMTISVEDSSGHTWSALASSLNPWSVNRMPGSTSPLLHKIVLQQIHIPTATLAAAALNLSSIAKVTFTGAVGLDGAAAGGEYLQDLTFDTPALGVSDMHPRSTVNVNSTTAEEGNGPGTDEVAVYLNTPSTSKVSAYLTVVGSATSGAGLAMQKVTFQPGETCKSVEIPVNGDTAPSAAAMSSFKIAVSDSTNGVLGKNDFGTIGIREDDALTTGGALAPPVGIQGDACAEYAALSHPGTLSFATGGTAPGDTVTVTGSGYRVGENVNLSIGSTVVTSAIAGPDGKVSFAATIPSDQALGATSFTAVGSGSGFTSKGSTRVLAATTTSLTLDPTAPTIKQSVTLTATVTGDTIGGGKVTFLDGTTALGTGTVAGGTATLKVPGGFLAGSHSITARFEETGTAASSTSAPVSIDLVKGKSAIALALGSSHYTFGQSVRGIISVAGATKGKATVTLGSVTLSVPINSSGVGSFTIPGVLAAGSHTISAQYDGTDLVAASPLSTEVFTVGKAVTQTILGLTKSTVEHGNTETVKVTVSGHQGSAYPTGTITVKSTVGNTVTTKVATLTSSRKGVTSFSLTLPASKGTASVVATYSGDTDFAASVSSVDKVRVD
jgi:hypothetical protein